MFLSLGERFDINKKYHYNYAGLRKSKSDRYRPTALIVATIYGYEEIVKLLLERDGLDISARTRVSGKCKVQGMFLVTALQIAESKGLTQIIQLLSAKINPTEALQAT